jgi:hypothetical protein
LSVHEHEEKRVRHSPRTDTLPTEHSAMFNKILRECIRGNATICSGPKGRQEIRGVDPSHDETLLLEG